MKIKFYSNSTWMVAPDRCTTPNRMVRVLCVNRSYLAVNTSQVGWTSRLQLKAKVQFGFSKTTF
jgi:hypothetical protein